MTDLTSYNTFAVGAACRELVRITDEADILPLLAKLRQEPHLIIGEGSNILFVDDFDGIVVHLETRGIHEVGSDGDSVLLEVAAGEKWEDFVRYCIAHSYYGVENLIGIPGLVGSCPVQNIGAYGAEVKDVIETVAGYRISTGQRFDLRNEACRFAYRSSLFKTEWRGDTLITRVRFRLQRKRTFNLSYQGLANALTERGITEPTLEDIAQVVIEVRNSKLPDIRRVGCAGSFFQNPIVEEGVRDELKLRFPNLVSYPAGEGRCKLAAGQLIDLSGLKGHREGDVGVWPHQALVIVNYGTATGRQVEAFYQKVQQRVFDCTGVSIVPEVNIVP